MWPYLFTIVVALVLFVYIRGEINYLKDSLEIGLRHNRYRLDRLEERFRQADEAVVVAPPTEAQPERPAARRKTRRRAAATGDPEKLIVDLLASRPEGMRCSELAAELHRSRSYCYKQLEQLEAKGTIRRGEDKHYTLVQEA
jgi:hypothetical protein